MAKSKKGFHFYNKMNRKEKRRFKKEFVNRYGIDRFNWFLLVETETGFRFFISGAFPWESTNQRHEYWFAISHKYN